MALALSETVVEKVPPGAIGTVTPLIVSDAAAGARLEMKPVTAIELAVVNTPCTGAVMVTSNCTHRLGWPAQT